MKTSLIKYAYKSINFYKIGRFLSGSNVTSAAPKGVHFKSAPKIKDLIIWVNLIGIDGTIRRVPGWPNEPLNSTFNRHFAAGFIASCDGGDFHRKYSDDTIAAVSTIAPDCGKCHVDISDPWFSYMKPKIHPVELHTLENTNSNVFPTSRLACCISLKPWMNEMIVRMHYEAKLQFLEEADDMTADSSIGGANPYKIYPY